MNTTLEHTLVSEKELAARLQVERDVMIRIRKGMVEGEDWEHQQGRGIFLTESGQQKISAALALLPGAGDGPPPEPEARDIVIARICANQRAVEGVPGEGEGRVLVRLGTGPSPFYRVGMVLAGCVRLEFAEQWEYRGRRPRRPGQF